MPSNTWVYPVVKPGPIETMGCLYLQPLITPTPVVTRLDDYDGPTDTPNGIVRVEAGSGTKVNLTEWNQMLLLHTYVPEEYEVQGEEIAGDVAAYMAAATGISVGGYQVTGVPHATAIQRRNDPEVGNLLRYLSFVTWRVAGTPLAGSN
jgi:hypothetical protein